MSFNFLKNLKYLLIQTPFFHLMSREENCVYCMEFSVHVSYNIMKPIRLLCYNAFLAFLDLTVHNVQLHSYHFELTDQ